MPNRGGQPGNSNAVKGTPWKEAIARALARAGAALDKDDQNRYRRGLDNAADKFVEACFAGDMWALKELGDRLDGKPAQAITGPNGEVPTGIALVFVEPEIKDVTPDLKLVEKQ